MTWLVGTILEIHLIIHNLVIIQNEPNYMEYP